MNLHAYVRALRRYWWVLALSGVLGASLGMLLTLQATPIYASKVTFFATTPNTGAANPLQGDQFGQQRVNSYVKLLTSQRLAERLVEEPGVDLSVRAVMGRIDGKADLNTVLFTATVQDSSQKRGLALVKGIAKEFPALVNDIESHGGAKNAPVRLEVVSGPFLNTDPVSPRKRLAVAVGLLGGLIVGTGVALVRVLLDRTVRTADALREVTGVPVLGTIPFDAELTKAPVLSMHAQTLQAESFRQLRTNLQFIDAEKPAGVLVVTSAVPGEGKSTICTNLAISFAEAGKTVVIVDADLRRPKIAKYLGLEGAVGLTNVLVGQAEIDDVLQSWGGSGMKVLPSGSIPPNPSELLGSPSMVDVISALRRRFDLVLIDAPPLLPVTDAVIATTRADGAVVVCRYGKTRRGESDRAVDAVRAVDGRVLGAILNRTPSKGVDALSYDTYTYLDHQQPHTASDTAAAVVRRVPVTRPAWLFAGWRLNASRGRPPA